MIARRSLLLAGCALPAVARAQCVTDTPAVDACRGGVRITQPPGVTLDLTFMVPGSLPSGITFTRASTATFFDSTGTMRTATTNAPRWDYDPVTHALRGLLIEEARTNLILSSNDITQAAWLKFGTPTVTGTVIAPDGTLTGQTIAVGSAPGGPAWYQIVNLASGIRAEPSFWINPISTVGSFNVQNPENNTNGDWFVNVSLLTPGWQRVTRTHPAVTILQEFTGFTDGKCGLFFRAESGAINASWWGCQLETGAFPTSYIPTTAASVTRAIDVANITPLVTWFNASTGTLLFEFDSTNSGEVTGGFSSGAFANVFYLGGSNVTAQVASASTVVSGTPILFTGVVQKSVAAYSTGRLAISNNGLAVATNATLPAPPYLWTSNLCIGNAPWAITNNGTTLDGHMRRVRYWPRALTNAELQSVTT